MNVAAAKMQKTSILRTASGEPPLGPEGLSFRADQGEMFEYGGPENRTPSARIGVLELNTGKWLAFPFGVDREHYETREQALRAGIADMIRKARRYMRAGEGQGTHWTEGFAGRVIEWALSLKPASRRAAVAEGHPVLRDTAPGKDVAISGASTPPHPLNEGETPPDAGVTDDRSRMHSGEVNQIITLDPIVRAYCEANRARTEYPVGHVVHHTNPVINGTMVSLGTCDCGAVFSYPWSPEGRGVLMPAAIEAHRQKFDHLPGKVDGRGNPIGEAPPAAKPKKERKRKNSNIADGASPPLRSEPASSHITAPHGDDDAGSTFQSPAAGGHAELQGPAPRPDPTSTGAGEIQAAQICAGDVKCEGCQPTTIEAASIEASAREVSEPLGLTGSQHAEVDPVREAGLHGGSLATDDDDYLNSPFLKAAAALAWREPEEVTAELARLLDFSKVYGPQSGKIRGPVGKVERPLLRWHGGKWKLAPWIMSHFPPHKVYIEPFGGAGSVLLQKQPSITEVWNDLEGEVVNLFRVLRSQADELARLIYLTPFAREEYHLLYEAVDDPLERARQFVARSFMGQSSKGALRKSGFDSRINPDGFASRLNSLRAMPEEFHAITERFRNVIIEQRPADEIFAQYDRQDVLFYVDPPYLSDRAKHYTHELDEDGHASLLKTLLTLVGMVVLSGYRSRLYDDALPLWKRVEIETHADGGTDRTEVVWLNPACAAALDQQHPTLFNIAAFDASANAPPLDDNSMTEGAET